MKIHEYQGKEIFRKYGVATPRGIACFGVDEAVQAASKLGGKVWVVKAQIHAGGRGKGGGVKVAKSLEEVRANAKRILGMQLVTHQTGPGGQKVRRLLVEEGADIAKELYVGMVVDRGTQRVVLMASAEGGMDIEEVAAKTPERISGFTSSREASVSQKHWYRPCSSALACARAACGTPIFFATPRASPSVSPAAGSTNTLWILSGVFAATSSMSMPPSAEAISATRCVPRSTTMPM